MSEPSSPEVQTVPESGRVYRAVTRYWPRIAVGLVVVLGAAEWIIGGLTADTGVEFYLMAWAGTTGGLWFLFEQAEKALGEESRLKVVHWLGEVRFQASLESIPDQFAVLFDRVFGERHFSVKCFARSSVASTVVVMAMAIVVLGWTGTPYYVPTLFQAWLIIALNVIPDFVSLLETRWALRWMDSTGRVVVVLLLDVVVTAAISAFAFLALNFGIAVIQGSPVIDALPLGRALTMVWTQPTTFVWAASGQTLDTIGPEIGPAVYFWSAFFTSIWLWLYAASVLLSRLLLRMNKGVGFLLKVSDVEKQPFRSMGFVSVIITSVIFALGLPLVLL
jgi:hypothetical protein